MGVKLQAPDTGRHSKIVIEGQFEYGVDDNGIVDVHPSHEAAARMIGFKDPEQVVAVVTAETSAAPGPKPSGATPPVEPAKTAELAEPDDEFKSMNMEALAKALTDAGIPEEEVSKLGSKKLRRDAIRAVVAVKKADADKAAADEAVKKASESDPLA